MFSDDYTQRTKIYTTEQKSEWLKFLNVFYNLAQTRTKLDRPAKQLRSNYNSELQSRKIDKQLTS